MEIDITQVYAEKSSSKVEQSKIYLNSLFINMLWFSVITFLQLQILFCINVINEIGNCSVDLWLDILLNSAYSLRFIKTFLYRAL